VNSIWTSNDVVIRQRFDAAIPAALTEVANEYARHLRLVLAQTFTEESEGKTAGSVKVSKLSGTSAFRIRVYSRWYRARFWELGWRHWTQKTRGIGKRSSRRYRLTAKLYRRPVWKPVLFENRPRYRALFVRRMEAAIGRRVTR